MLEDRGSETDHDGSQNVFSKLSVLKGLFFTKTFVANPVRKIKQAK